MSALTVSKLYSSYTLKKQVKPGMMQLYGTACALYKEALSLISAPKTKGEGGKETNHTGLIELSTCGLYESKLLKKNSSNMNTEDNTNNS